MTPQFKEFFDKLCQRWPERFGLKDDVFSFDKVHVRAYPEIRLWFLHELAAALGGVVWVEVNAYRAGLYLWDGYYGTSTGSNHAACRNVDTQLLALESAVIALGEEVMRTR